MRQKIVGIKKKVSFNIVYRIVALDAVKEVLQGIAFGATFIVGTFIAYCSVLACDICGVIGAVVCNYINFKQFARISLLFYALEQMTENGFFIACGYYYSVSVLILCSLVSACAKQAKYGKQTSVCI